MCKYIFLSNSNKSFSNPWTTTTSTAAAAATTLATTTMIITNAKRSFQFEYEKNYNCDDHTADCEYHGFLQIFLK